MSFEGEKNEKVPMPEKYLSKIDSDGYVRIGDFATEELGRQAKSVASFLDGDEGTGDYNFGDDLRYKGSSGNYSDMKLHIDDVEIFIERIKRHYGV